MTTNAMTDYLEEKILKFILNNNSGSISAVSGWIISSNFASSTSGAGSSSFFSVVIGVSSGSDK